MSIKLISKSELISIQDLAYATWPETFQEILTKEQITYMLSWMYDLKVLEEQIDKGHLFYIYFENEIPTGFIGIELHCPDEKTLKIHKLYVLPNAQGLGIGKKLIQKAIEIGEEHQIENLVLNVNRFNKAVAFYQKFGFNIDYEEDIDIGNNYLMEDFVMSYKL